MTPLAAGALVTARAAMGAGCVFDEQPTPFRTAYYTRSNPGPASRPADTRAWIKAAHQRLEHLLPPRGRRVLLTEQLTTPAGDPVDVYSYFEKDPSTLTLLRHNWYGILHTAQGVSRSSAIDQPAPEWPGFQTVWVPVGGDIRLHGRIGLSTGPDGQPRKADCIVLIPGFLGDNAVQRTREVAIALLTNGFHVIALELRGHGQVERFNPNLYYTFGVLETQDLLKVSEWLEDTYPCVQRTGLIGFCWGGNHGMMAAWFDGRGPDDPSISPRLAAILDPPSPRRHYTAGIMAFSPVLSWESLMERADLPHDLWTDASTHFFQETIKGRMARKGYPEVSGSLRQLINYEFARSSLGPSFPMTEVYNAVRLLPHKGRDDGDKLESARVPLLLVTSVNDPFLSAQDMAVLASRTSNPQVACLLLRGGGHIGFGPYSPAYFYSLILDFFDSQTGAAAGR